MFGIGLKERIDDKVKQLEGQIKTVIEVSGLQTEYQRRAEMKRQKDLFRIHEVVPCDD